MAKGKAAAKKDASKNARKPVSAVQSASQKAAAVEENSSPEVSEDELIELGEASDDEEVEIDEDYSDSDGDNDEIGEQDESDDEVPEEFAGFDESEDDNVEKKEGEDVETKDLKLSEESEQQIKSKIAAKEADGPKLTKKQRRELAAAANEKPGVLYIGRIPHGFYEHQMRNYFSQFGDVLRLRLSRNKKTGASKHYAFIEFASSDVAEIVAETMNNYLLYGHILKVSVVPENQVHEKLFVGSNRKFKRIPTAKLAKHKHDRKRSGEEIEKLVAREEKRRATKQDKLKELGIDYIIPAPALKA